MNTITRVGSAYVEHYGGEIGPTSMRLTFTMPPTATEPGGLLVPGSFVGFTTKEAESLYNFLKPLFDKEDKPNG